MNFRLYLMRHSKTEDPGNKEDFARNLTIEGHEHAKQAADFIKNYQVDKMVVSFVKRATQTSSFIEKVLDNPVIEIVEELYKSDEDKVIDMFTQLDDNYKHILVIGHNPIIYNVAMSLADDSSHEYDALLSTGMPPARIIVLDFPDINSWQGLRRGTANIIDIFTPS